MVGLQPVGVVRCSQPPWNNCQLQALTGSSVVPTSSSSGTSIDDDSRYPTTRQEYIATLNPQGSNARFCLKSGDDSVSTDEESPYSPSEGSAIKTDLPGHDGEIDEEGVDNPGSLSTAKEPGNGTGVDKKVHPDLEQIDTEQIRLITPDQIAGNSKVLFKRATGTTGDPIQDAMASEGILPSDD